MSAARRVVVVSHPCVVPENQGVYRALTERGWDPTVIVPHRWRHAYEAKAFSPRPIAGLEGRLARRRVLLTADPARHFYAPGIGEHISGLRPAIAFVEAESYSVVALQMALVLGRREISYGVQADENLERPLPRPVSLWRGYVLRNSAFVAARSPRAAELVRRWGARGQVAIVPHALPDWDLPEGPPPERAIFTVGYAGRLVEEKGVLDLVAAARALSPPVRLLLVGEGPLRGSLEGLAADGLQIDVRTASDQSEMPGLYRQMDVLVLPSRTTPTWAEQFGRVVPEALVCGVPAIGSDSGEIPWVIGSTGGGWTFPEGDVAALTERLAHVRDSPADAAEHARRGGTAAREQFSTDAAATSLADLLSRALE